MAKRTIEERFRLVAETTDDLGRHPIVARRARTTLEVKFDSAGLRASVTEPDPVLLRSLLPTVRKFLMDGDDHHLPEVHNLALRHIDDPELVHAIESVKEGYKRERRGLGLQLQIDGARVTPEHAADLWINGVYLHSDVDKERELNSLTGIAPALVRNAFLEFVFALTSIAIFTGSVLAEALRRGAVRNEVVQMADRHPHAVKDEDGTASSTGALDLIG
jgi:hypothetical protein